MKYTYLNCVVAAGLTLGLAVSVEAETVDITIRNTVIGADNNSAANPFIQPQDPAFSGGGRDQTMQFGDIVTGNSTQDDLLIGRLGVDLLFGRGGDDVLIGGIEHFNPLNRDRAFGGPGDDIFIWKPGDGSDLFQGGRGEDAVVFGVVGERVNGAREFAVLNDQQAGEVAINRNTGLPKVDVKGSPGFCTVIDEASAPEAKRELAALGLDHLVQFSIRRIADEFDAGIQSEDNGLRVTLHLKGVEYVVCTERAGETLEVLDLRQSPPAPINLGQIEPQKLRERLRRIVK